LYFVQSIWVFNHTVTKKLSVALCAFSCLTLRSASRPRWELIGRRDLQKAVHGVQIALNIADVSAPAGQQPVRRMATPHPSLVAVASQPEMDTQVGDMEGRKWQGVLCVQPYWITCGWLISRRCRQLRQCPEGRPGWFPKCLLIQGDAQLNTWRCSHRTRLV
jgi:hypothetical protein